MYHGATHSPSDVGGRNLFVWPTRLALSCSFTTEGENVIVPGLYADSENELVSSISLSHFGNLFSTVTVSKYMYLIFSLFVSKANHPRCFFSVIQ